MSSDFAKLISLSYSISQYKNTWKEKLLFWYVLLSFFGKKKGRNFYFCSYLRGENSDKFSMTPQKLCTQEYKSRKLGIHERMLLDVG